MRKLLFTLVRKLRGRKLLQGENHDGEISLSGWLWIQETLSLWLSKTLTCITRKFCKIIENFCSIKSLSFFKCKNFGFLHCRVTFILLQNVKFSIIYRKRKPAHKYLWFFVLFERKGGTLFENSSIGKRFLYPVLHLQTSYGCFKAFSIYRKETCAIISQTFFH